MKIEKNIPIPKVHNARGHDRAWAKEADVLEKLEIGDSFFWPCEKNGKIDLLRNRINSVINRTLRDPEFSDRRFTTRKEKQPRKEGIRIWRIQ